MTSKKSPHAPPAAWISDLRKYASEVRALSGHYATQRGEFFHSRSYTLQLKSDRKEGTYAFDVYEREDEAETHLGILSEVKIIELVWNRLTVDGLKYAHEKSVSRMRGQVEMLDASGSILNDQFNTRRQLPSSLTPEPLLDGDDEEEASRKTHERELIDLREQNRKLKAAVDDIQASQLEEVKSIADVKREIISGIVGVGDDMLAYYSARRAELQEDVVDRQKQAVFGAILSEFVPKVGGLCDAAMIGLRTLGGRQEDALAVPPMPPTFQLWLIDIFGESEYTKIAAKLVRVSSLSPQSEDYAKLWDSILMEIEEGLAHVEAKGLEHYPEPIAKRCRTWGVKASKALKISPHRFSRICKMKGTKVKPDSPDPEDPKQDNETGRGPDVDEAGKEIIEVQAEDKT